MPYIKQIKLEDASGLLKRELEKSRRPRRARSGILCKLCPSTPAS